MGLQPSAGPASPQPFSPKQCNQERCIIHIKQMLTDPKIFVNMVRRFQICNFVMLHDLVQHFESEGGGPRPRIFFFVYITIIVFAVIRVISAIFLKDTLDAAQNDAENLVFDRLSKKASYVKKLEQIFRAIDSSADGMVTEEKLSNILANPTVVAYFQTLDVDAWLGQFGVLRLFGGTRKCKQQAQEL